MAITFPASPTNGQTFTSGNKTWQWDGTTWLAYGASLSPTVLKVDAANARVGVNNQSPAYALDVNGTIEATQFLQGTDYLSPYQGFRNTIINGAMDVWQRGTSFANASASPYYTVDRFQTYRAGAVAGMTASRQTSALDGFTYSLRVQRDNGNTSVNEIVVNQTFETQNIRKHHNKFVTLSFYARCGANFSSASSALNFGILAGTGTDGSIANGLTGQAYFSSGTATLTTTFQRFTVTTSAVLPTSKTQLGIIISFIPVGTAGANDWVEITGVQLEQGSVATPFEHRPIGTELALCQRYYQVINLSSSYGMPGFCDTTNLFIGVTSFPEMRTSPSVAFFGSNEIRRPGIAATLVSSYTVNSGKSGVRVNATTTTATLVAGQGAILTYASGTPTITLSSEF